MARRDGVRDRSSIDRRVGAVDASALAGPVRSVLGEASARVTSWRHEHVAYDFLNPSSGGVYRFAGTAQARGGRREWRLVLKVTRSPESVELEPPLPPALVETLREAVLWDRELHAYESGFLGGLEGGLVAPRYHGGARHEDDTCWLWLDDLGDAEQGGWPLERWSDVGRALGAFNGTYLGRRALPGHDWLGRDWLRVWVTQLTPFHFAGSTGPGAAWDSPLVRAAYPDALRERVWALWSDRELLLRGVEGLPRTCCHLDAHRRNLFLRPGDDGTQVVAIDWGLVGLASPGEELASTVVGTVASGEVDVGDAEQLAAILYDGYLSGLREAGWNGDQREIRLGFTAAAAVRALSVLGLEAAADPKLDPGDAAATLSRSAALATFLVGLGDEARSLLAYAQRA